MDYRLKENREEYFDRFYTYHTEHGLHPGLVYRYMPQLAEHFNWSNDQRLWFSVINGATQNPITSMVIFRQQPEPFTGEADYKDFKQWFDKNWFNLAFDTDRRYAKKFTPELLNDYSSNWVKAKTLYNVDTEFNVLWRFVIDRVSFGRLSTFSHIEYAYINGMAPDCNTMFYADKSGSKSHRNGTFFLLGKDELVWDKRQPDSHDGNYSQFKNLTSSLEDWADEWLAVYKVNNPQVKYAGKFTLESALCAFKNSFFGRRYPGVYADMAANRIIKAAEDGVDNDVVNLFVDMYNTLPDGVREHLGQPINLNDRAMQFKETGMPYRHELLGL